MIETARRPELMGVTIRPATLKDVRAINRIAGNARRRFMPPYFDGGRELNKQWIEDNKINGPGLIRDRIRAMRNDPTQNLAYVATISDEKHHERVAGYIFGDVKRVDKDGAPEVVRIADFGVRDDYTFRGVGGLLEKELYKWARDELGAQIDVEIPNTNLNAIRFFRNRGYDYKYSHAVWPNDERWSVAAPTILFQLHPKGARYYSSRRYPNPPPRPEWHEPWTRWEETKNGQFHYTQVDDKHGTKDMQRDFMLNRAALLMNEENHLHPNSHPNVRRLEAAGYELLAQPDEQIHSSNFLPITQNDQLIGVLDPTLPQDEFMKELIKQREKSFKEVNYIAQVLERYNVIGRASGVLNLPAVMLNVDNPEHFPNLGVTSEKVTAALQEAPQWKASEHMFLFSDKDEAHDYRRYALKESADLDMDLGDFLLRQQVHEGLHPIIDYFTDHWYHEYSTWLNESFCDVWAGFYKRAKNRLLKVEDVGSIKMEDVMTTVNRNLLQGGGYFLLKSIGSAINPESMYDGISTFMSKIFGSDVYPKNSGVKLNDVVMWRLKEMGVLPIVKQLFEKEMHYLSSGSDESNMRNLIESTGLDLYRQAKKDLRLAIQNKNSKREDPDYHGLYPAITNLWDTLNVFSLDPDQKEKFLSWHLDQLKNHPNTHTRVQASFSYYLIMWYCDIEAGEAELVRYEEGPDGIGQRPVYKKWSGHEFRADHDPVPIIMPREPALAEID